MPIQHMFYMDMEGELMQETILLKTNNITKSFGGHQVLKGINIEIKKGEIHCLAGENGCGKSTLIKIISGDYKADSGEITIDGMTYSRITPKDSIKNGIQVIYQDFSVFPNLSVMENIAIAHNVYENRKLVSWRKYRDIAQKAIDKIGFDIDLDANAGELSVAQRQMVAIARAIYFNAKLIIMDEPTSALTQKEVQRLFHVVGNLKASGVSIVFVSHKIDEVFAISDRITIMRNGEHIITTDASELTSERFAYYMTGRNLNAQTQFIYDQENGETVISVENLTKKNAYKDISFSVRRGEIFGITGLLGSGRTELALSLFGLMPADSGKIHFLGNEVSINSAIDAKNLGIGYVPEDRTTEGLFLPQSIEDNMTITILDKYEILRLLYDKKELKREAKEWEKNLRIKLASQANPVLSLSGGNQQKVVLAKWLATDMHLLILNGPTVGVDIGAKYDIYQILQDLAAEGIAIIMITDDLEELLPNCDSFMIMKDGVCAGRYRSCETSKEEVSKLIGKELSADEGLEI